jgi:hypothetical protein
VLAKQPPEMQSNRARKYGGTCWRKGGESTISAMEPARVYFAGTAAAVLETT